MYGLGLRLIPDPRDAMRTIESAFDEVNVVMPDGVRGSWPDGQWTVDQGDEPIDVAIACLHHSVASAPTAAPPMTPRALYAEAQARDELAPREHWGTTIRAACEALDALGHVTGYWSTRDQQVMIQTLLHLGPLVVGTDWAYSMDHPREDGRIALDGAIRGAHAYLLDGVDAHARTFTLRNSWGEAWGDKGRATIDFDTFAGLMLRGGEAWLLEWA